ncbi:hypothetical protein J6590_097815 [Homalodisca vitripennis]|nr:hypothetical protein J6590_097815 [Homalodisca vitripennis]
MPLLLRASETISGAVASWRPEPPRLPPDCRQFTALAGLSASHTQQDTCDFWKSDVALGTPPLEKAQEALTALTVFLPFPGPPSAPIPIPVPWYWMHWRCAR